jgi:hypothetical protein
VVRNGGKKSVAICGDLSAKTSAKWREHHIISARQIVCRRDDVDVCLHATTREEDADIMISMASTGLYLSCDTTNYEPYLRTAGCIDADDINKAKA